MRNPTNPTTSRGVFIEAAGLVLIAEGARWVAGVYDTLSTAKLVGILIIALISAVIAGYRSVRALNTDPTEPKSHP